MEDKLETELVARLERKIRKYGDLVSPFIYWTDYGQPISDQGEAKEKWIRTLPNGLFPCGCSKRHHMIAPSRQNGKIFFELEIYGHYYYRGLFRVGDAFLVRCLEGHVSLVEVSRFSESAASTGKVVHSTGTLTLERLKEKIIAKASSDEKPLIYLKSQGLPNNV